METGYLKLFGFTEYESRSLIAIGAIGKKGATALELVEFTKIPNTKIYQVLKILQYRGFVLFENKEVNRYRLAIRLKTILTRIAKQKLGEINSLLLNIDKFLGVKKVNGI